VIARAEPQSRRYCSADMSSGSSNAAWS